MDQLANHDVQIDGLLAPAAAHDDLAFDELRGVYSFGKTSERRILFCNMILNELTRFENPVVLDIGCGSGMGSGKSKFAYVQAIRDSAGFMIGIEPDKESSPPAGLFDRFEHSFLEDSTLEPNSVDLAYSHYVMEHVEHPEQFLQKMYEVLKPGGVYFFITPNGKSYFVKIARFFKAFGFDQLMLRLLRSSSKVEDYHYPVVYKFNHDKRIRELALKAGFQSAETAYYERAGAYGYFPGLLKPVLWGLNLKRKLLANKTCLLNLVVRLQK